MKTLELKQTTPTGYADFTVNGTYTDIEVIDQMEKRIKLISLFNEIGLDFNTDGLRFVLTFNPEQYKAYERELNDDVDILNVPSETCYITNIAKKISDILFL